MIEEQDAWAVYRCRRIERGQMPQGEADFTPLSDAERARRWRTFSAVWLYAFAIIVVAIAAWAVI